MPKTYKPWQFKPGARAGPGRPRKTETEKEAAKVLHRYAKQKADSFKAALDNILPLAVDRVHEIVAKRSLKMAANHLRAFELVSDRVFGKPPQAITGAQGGPLVVSFQQILGKVDGGKRERLG